MAQAREVQSCFDVQSIGITRARLAMHSACSRPRAGLDLCSSCADATFKTEMLHFHIIERCGDLRGTECLIPSRLSSPPRSRWSRRGPVLLYGIASVPSEHDRPLRPTVFAIRSLLVDRSRRGNGPSEHGSCTSLSARAILHAHKPCYHRCTKRAGRAEKPPQPTILVIPRVVLCIFQVRLQLYLT